MVEEGLLAHGYLYSADFDEKRLTFRIQGDVPPVSKRRYAIVDADRFRMLVMTANAYHEQRKAGKANG